MTEIEQAFYDTLKTLEADYGKGLEALREESQQREIAFSKAVSDLGQQVDSLSERNGKLSAQVIGLSDQVTSLSNQVMTLVSLLRR